MFERGKGGVSILVAMVMTDLCRPFVNTRDDVIKLPFFVRGWRRGIDALL